MANLPIDYSVNIPHHRVTSVAGERCEDIRPEVVQPAATGIPLERPLEVVLHLADWNVKINLSLQKHSQKQIRENQKSCILEISQL